MIPSFWASRECQVDLQRESWENALQEKAVSIVKLVWPPSIVSMAALSPSWAEAMLTLHVQAWWFLRAQRVQGARLTIPASTCSMLHCFRFCTDHCNQ